jgi:hypothetical protein
MSCGREYQKWLSATSGAQVLGICDKSATGILTDTVVPHGEVRDDHVGAEFFGCIHDRSPIVDHTNQIEFFLEERFKRLCD